MKFAVKAVIFGSIFPIIFSAAGFCQNLFENYRQQVDAVVQEAYRSASAELPCKLKAGGKPKMLRWQSADKCLNDAHEGIDWENISGRLREIQEKSGSQTADFLAAVESSLSAHALTYDKVFAVEDEKVLLPLSNSILKFLPADSLLDLPVTDKTGKKVGAFAGTYTFEKMGEISGTKQRHFLFQYTDLNGKMQSSSERLLLDAFGVPWKDAAKQRGFCLPANKISLRRDAGEREAINPRIPRKPRQ